MISKKMFDMIFVFSIIILLALNTLLIAYVMKYKEAFFSNPLIFGASKISKDITCYCQVPRTEGLQILYINSTSMWSKTANMDPLTNYMFKQEITYNNLTNDILPID